MGKLKDAIVGQRLWSKKRGEVVLMEKGVDSGQFRCNEGMGELGGIRATYWDSLGGITIGSTYFPDDLSDSQPDGPLTNLNSGAELWSKHYGRIIFKIRTTEGLLLGEDIQGMRHYWRPMGDLVEGTELTSSDLSVLKNPVKKNYTPKAPPKPIHKVVISPKAIYGKIDFDSVLKRRLIETDKVLGLKAKEYATNSNRYHNFDVAARILDTSPEKALLGMLMKHIVSVIDLIDAAENEGLLTEYLINEKVGDIINYIHLLEGILLRTLHHRPEEKV